MTRRFGCRAVPEPCLPCTLEAAPHDTSRMEPEKMRGFVKTADRCTRRRSRSGGWAQGRKYLPKALRRPAASERGRGQVSFIRSARGTCGLTVSVETVSPRTTISVIFGRRPPPEAAKPLGRTTDGFFETESFVTHLRNTSTGWVRATRHDCQSTVLPAIRNVTAPATKKRVHDSDTR